MKIMLITTLYPAFKNQSRMNVTYAVHYFAREWAKNHDVIVIRLWNYYPKLFLYSNKAKEANKYAYKEKFTIEDVDVYRYPINKIPKIDFTDKEILKVSKGIEDIIKLNGKPDLVICDKLNPAIFIGEKIEKKHNSKLIASLHHSDINYITNKKNRNKIQKISNSISKIALRSDNVERQFKKIYKENNIIINKSYKVLFGINESDTIDIEKMKLKIRKPISSVLVAASLIELKNIDILIKAFYELKEYNKYELRIIGDGPERNKLEQLVKDLDISDNVIFYGEKKRSEVLDIMEDSNIFAMVSSPETFGLVYIEAMGKGCITIGSRNEGIDGVIKNGENGYLCKPNDVNELKVILDNVIKLDLQSKEKIIKKANKTAKSLSNSKLSKCFLERALE